MLNYRSDVPMDWQQEALPDSVREKISGETREGFLTAMDEWCDYLAELPPYDESAIREKLDEIEIQMPASPTYKDALVAHYRLSRQMHEVTRIKNLVKPHFEGLDTAFENLLETGQAIAAGTNKEQRVGNATAMVRRFAIYRIRTKNLLDYIVDVYKELEFAGWQMQRAAKDLDNALRRGDSTMLEQGAVIDMQRSSGSSSYSKPHTGEGPDPAVDWDTVM
jgi:hypothetical protein